MGAWINFNAIIALLIQMPAMRCILQGTFPDRKLMIHIISRRVCMTAHLYNQISIVLFNIRMVAFDVNYNKSFII